MLMVMFLFIGVAVALSNMFSRFAPLQLPGDAAYLSVFTKSQLDALALAPLRLRTGGAAIP
jgi:hypothetical protein